MSVNKNEVQFCLKCGLVLDKKWNKNWDGKKKQFCDKKCETLYKR